MLVGSVEVHLHRRPSLPVQSAFGCSASFRVMGFTHTVSLSLSPGQMCVSMRDFLKPCSRKVWLTASDTL